MAWGLPGSIFGMLFEYLGGDPENPPNCSFFNISGGFPILHSVATGPNVNLPHLIPGLGP